jgi:hypothetical protein
MKRFTSGRKRHTGGKFKEGLAYENVSRGGKPNPLNSREGSIDSAAFEFSRKQKAPGKGRRNKIISVPANQGRRKPNNFFNTRDESIDDAVSILSNSNMSYASNNRNHLNF